MLSIEKGKSYLFSIISTWTYGWIFNAVLWVQEKSKRKVPVRVKGPDTSRV